MPAVNKIYIQTVWDSADAEKSADQLNKKIESFGKTADDASQKASGGIKRVTVSTESATSAMERMAQSIGALGLLGLGKRFFDIAEDLNRMRLGFEALDGGTVVMQGLQKIALETGADLNKLAKGALDLAHAGVAAELLAKDMKILDDASAKAGVSMEEVLAATNKLLAMQSKGKVSTRGVAVFGDLGIQFRLELQKTLGLTRQGLQEEYKNIDPTAYREAILKSMQNFAQGAAKAMADIDPGRQLGILQNELKVTAEELLTTLAPALIFTMKQIEGLLEFGRSMIAVFNELPGPIKNTAIAVGLLAVGINAISKAVALFQLLPAGIGLLGSIQGVAVGAAAGITTLVESIGAATYGLGLFEAATVAAKVTLTTFAPEIVIVISVLTELYLLYKKFKELQDQAAETAAGKAYLERGDLIAKAASLQADLKKAHAAVPKEPDIRLSPNAKADEIKKVNEDLVQYVGLLKQAKEQSDKLLEANEEKVKRANEYGAKLLADTLRDQLKIGQESVAALDYAWQEHWKNTKDGAKGTADAVAALGEAVVTEALKQIEIVKTARKKANLEAAATERKIGIAQIEAIPDSGYAAQIQLAETKYEARRIELRQIADAEIREFDDKMRQQISDVPKTTADEIAKSKTPQQVKNALDRSQAAINYFVTSARETRQMADEKADRETALARVEMEKSVYATLASMEKEQRDFELQAELQSINTIRDYEIANATAVEAQTKQQKLAQIAAIEQANITAIEKTKSTQLASLDIVKKQYEDLIDAAQKLGIITEEQARLRVTGFSDEQQKQRQQIEAQYQRDSQLQRIEAWRSANQVIIEEQKQVYESIAGFAGQLFDAFVQKNKSIWSAIGDVIKNTLLGAIKSVITSRVAATLTGILGYGQVGIAQGPLAQQQPVFAGMGPAPAIAPTPTATSVMRTDSGLGGLLNVFQGQVARGIPGVTYSPLGGYAPSGGPAPVVATTQPFVPPTQESRDREMEDFGPAAAGMPSVGELAGLPQRPTPTFGGIAIPQLSRMDQIKQSLGIGQPIRIGGGQTVPWSSASPQQKLGAIVSSKGFASLAGMIGVPAALAGIQRAGIGGAVLGTAGGAIAGAGLLGGLSLGGGLALSPLGGAVIGGGAALLATGVKQGGVLGAIETTLGGAAAGFGIGAAIGAMGGPIGAVAGALIGAGIGATIGIVRAIIGTPADQARKLIRQTWGVDIKDKATLNQVVDIANQKYHGDMRLAVASQEVQDLVRLYSLMTGQRALLPRPMYPATYAQSAAGGLQLQPVYSGGQLVSNPYTGTTTTQVSNALAGYIANPPVFIQMNPGQAAGLLSGQIVQVIGNNPGAVGAANTTAARSGQGRQAQSGALLEPSTVMA